VSAALKESTQTYVMRRFPQRGRGFAHATVAGLVSRSRFLWFWLLYGRVRAPMPLFQQFKRCSLSRPTACDGPPMLVPLFRSCDRRSLPETLFWVYRQKEIAKCSFPDDQSVTVNSRHMCCCKAISDSPICAVCCVLVFCVDIFKLAASMAL
jgi:hypothetical protein